MTVNINNSQIGYVLVQEDQDVERPRRTEAFEQKLYYRSDRENIRQHFQVHEWLPIARDIKSLTEKLAQERKLAGANFAPEKYGIYRVSAQEISKAVSLEQAADTAALMTVIEGYGKLERLGPVSPLQESINALEALKNIFARASEINPVEGTKDLVHKGFVAARTSLSRVTEYCSRNSDNEHHAQRSFLQRRIEADFKSGLVYVSADNIKKFQMRNPPQQLSYDMTRAEHFKDPVGALKAMTFFNDASCHRLNYGPHGPDKFDVIQVRYAMDHNPMTQAEIEAEEFKSSLAFMKPDNAATVMKLAAKPLSF